MTTSTIENHVVLNAKRSMPQPEDRFQQRLHILAQELTMAETRERQRIARELHDEIGQLLAVARFKVHELRSCPPDEHAPHLEELGQLLEQASRATRSATFDLSSPALSLGLDEALRSLTQRLSRQAATVFHFEGQMPALNWSQPMLAVLYRVTRELAVNAQRHAHARQVGLRLQVDARQLRITVSDDGIGIAPDWAKRGLRRDGGFGLVSCHAQMKALGGTLVVESGVGSGTLATMTLPLEQALHS